MSRVSKPSTAAALSDAVLGCFRHAQPSETLNHLVRYLSTWSGSDKLFTLLCYTLKLAAPFLRMRAGLQYEAGLRKSAESFTAKGFEVLAGKIGDSRSLWRFFGMFSIFQWLIALEKKPPQTRTLLTIERLQGWAMLGYYPLEHLSYLVGHGIVGRSVANPLAFLSARLPRRLRLDAGALGMWSCRFWALYVFLHIAHLIEDRKLLLQRHRALKKSKPSGLSAEEKAEIATRWDGYWSEVVVNLANAPLTLHYSLPGGLGVLGDRPLLATILNLIATVAGFRAGWKATALAPAPAPAASSTADDKTEL